MPIKIENYKPHFLEIASKSISASGSADIEYTFSDELTIVRLFIWETSGADLYNVSMTLRIEDEYITHDSIPAEIFNTDRRDAWELNWRVKNGTKLYMTLTNNGSSTVNVKVFAEIVK